MTDRALLEKAAHAFWAGEIDDVVSIRWCDADACILYIHGDNQDHNGIDREYRWNPLEENHDAFELAVKLRLGLHFETQSVPPGDDIHVREDVEIVEVFGPTDDETGGCHCEMLSLDKDPCAATRRAVVMAAAALVPKGT